MKDNKIEVEDQSYDDPTNPPQEGRMFLKNGKVGIRYVVADINKVVDIACIAEGCILVTFPPVRKWEGVSRHTEVVPYKESEHEHLIKKPIKEKEEE